jgi:Zn2+/Cd2+-exporting ATPase
MTPVGRAPGARNMTDTRHTDVPAGTGHPADRRDDARHGRGHGRHMARARTGWRVACRRGPRRRLCAGGIPAGLRAVRALIVERILDIDLLMVVAAVAAAAVGAPLEGAVLLTLFSISTTLEARALGRARRAIEALMALRPETALRKGGRWRQVEEVPAADLAPGDVVVLRPGARVPADGVIVDGQGSLDESTITGESMPVHKQPGAQVFEATVNLDGVLDIRVSKPLGESTVARMIALVTEAQAAKAPSERFSAWFGQRYTIGVMAGATLAFLVFLWLGRGWEDALYRAATMLVAASPCAIVISVPAAILSALSAAARGGVLFKGGAALETLATVRTFAFDKTGTLTTGQAEVTEMVVLEGEERPSLPNWRGSKPIPNTMSARPSAVSLPRSGRSSRQPFRDVVRAQRGDRGTRRGRRDVGRQCAHGRAHGAPDRPARIRRAPAGRRDDHLCRARRQASGRGGRWPTGAPSSAAGIAALRASGVRRS